MLSSGGDCKNEHDWKVKREQIVIVLILYEINIVSTAVQNCSITDEHLFTYRPRNLESSGSIYYYLRKGSQ